MLLGLRRAEIWLFLVLGAGCGGKSGATTAGLEKEPTDNAWAAAVSIASAAGGEVQVSARIGTSEARTTMAALELSEDAGASYRESKAPRIVLAPSRHEQQATWLWRPEIDGVDSAQDDLRARVVPWTHRGQRRGRSADSDVFGLGSGSPPRVVGAAFLEAVAGGTTALEVQVADDEGDHVEVEAEVSVDGGAFAPATIREAGERRAVAAGKAGTAMRIHWLAQADAPDVRGRSARLRLRASDSVAGEPFLTAAVPLRTVAPSVARFTIEGIDEAMNGSVPFINLDRREEEFRLMVPASGFRLTVEAAPVPGGDRLDMASTAVHSSRAFGASGRGSGAGVPADLSSYFAPDAGTLVAHWTVPEAASPPAGVLVLEATVADVLGNRSLSRALSFEVASGRRQDGPLEETEHWLLVFDRDNFTLESSAAADGRIVIEAREEANGIADYLEDLAVLGLALVDAVPGTEAARLSDRVAAWTQEAIRGHLYRHFGRATDAVAAGDAPDIRFHLSAPGGPVSRLGVGGDDPIPGYTIGRAHYDHRNSRRNDNSVADLGIFTTNIVDYHVNASGHFRRRFDPFIPGRGQPLGSSSADAQILLADFDPDAPGASSEAVRRHDELVGAVDAWARMVALTAAHEIGHSLGLVANGPPPRGLFGGERNAAFAGPFTNAYHLDTAGSDIMSAALSFHEALLDGEAGPRFNALHWAYLLGRVTLQ